MSDSRFGVSLICYNEEKNLPECLNHIFSQSLLPSKVIIIDDMSTDTTPEIIKKYKKIYPEISSYKSNAKKLFKDINIAYAIHLSLKKMLDTTNVNYIVRMDSDAILEDRDTFKKLIRTMEKNPSLGITSAYYGKKLMDAICDAVRVYRRNCIFQIMENNPLPNQKKYYPLMYGHDSFVLWRARFHGYQISQSNVKYKDVRPYNRTVWQWYQTGWFRYMNGFGWFHQFGATIRYIRAKPIIIGSLICLLSYMLFHFKPRNVFESEYVDFMRREFNTITIQYLRGIARGKLSEYVV